MNIFFAVPFAVSLAAAWYMAFVSEGRIAWRLIAVGLALIAAVLQALNWLAPAAGVHFLIPLLIQVFVSIGVYFYAMSEDGYGGW